MPLCDWSNHFGGQNNINKIIMVGDQASNIEESGEFTECQRDQKITQPRTQGAGEEPGYEVEGNHSRSNVYYGADY